MKGKLLKVFDKATEVVMLAVEFEEHEKPLLASLGWGLENPPKLIVHLFGGGGAAASISHFDYPPSDLGEQSLKMPVNTTTISFADLVREFNIEDLAEEVDLREDRIFKIVRDSSKN